MLLHFKCLLWLFPLLGILCSRHLRDKFSHFFQVFAQIYCFSEVYPDNPNLKLGLTQSNSLPWPLLFQIFFILIYDSVLITHHIWIYSKIYVYYISIVYCLWMEYKFEDNRDLCFVHCQIPSTYNGAWWVGALWICCMTGWMNTLCEAKCYFSLTPCCSHRNQHDP